MKCTLFLTSALSAAFALTPAAAFAQDVNLNYDSLSSFEEPLSLEAGNVTVSLTGLADANITADFDNLIDDDEVTVGFVTNFQVAAETQLSNRWTVGAVYFGQYAENTIGAPDEYSDNVAGFIGTSFGTVLGGNVNGQVRELTRRQRGVGNGVLAFDDFYGQLDNWGGAYIGRFGPSIIGAAVDENGDFEVGAQFQRPLGERDVRFTGRYRQARFTAPDGINQFDTKGAGLVAELVYGSSLWDFGAAYERLDSALVDADRWFVSAGGQNQMGPLQLSVEGHYGQLDGADEISGAVGASYAIARGLSLNLGGNYSNATIAPDGVTLINTDEVTAVSSIRFAF
ncbi:MAG: hypothetical protein AAGK17_14430 [Pseudomonadota bacterium]